MTTPPTDELTDERLAAIEERWTENNMIHGDIYTLTQEVRRLRGLVEDRGEAIARAGTAEAEVERLRGLEELGQANMNIVLAREKRLEAERDRYRGALEEIASYGPELDNTEPTPVQAALAALKQQGDTQSKP